MAVRGSGKNNGTQDTTAGSPLTGSPLAFFVVLFALSIPFWVAGAIFTGPTGLPMGMPASAFQFVLPLVVALLLAYRQGRWRGITALLRRTFSVRGSARLGRWILVIALVPASMLLTYAAMALAGAPPHGPHSPLSALPVLLMLFVVGAVCEEAGWMGYVAVPLQQRWGGLLAGVILGVVLACWHLVGWVQADREMTWLVGQFLSTVAIRVLMVWLFDATGRLVLTAVLIHALVNVAQSIFPGYTEQSVPAVIFGLVTALIALIVGWQWVQRNPTAAVGAHP